jgi:enterochelin esterase family protein
LVNHSEEEVVGSDLGMESPATSEPQSAEGVPGSVNAPQVRKLHPKLRALFGGAGPTPRRIRNFVSRERFPLVDRDAITFIFSGEVEAVYLHHFMRGLPSGLAFTRVDGTCLWHLRLPVPPDSRFEYKFDVVQNGHGTWINDPLNPVHATDPFGTNSVGTSYDYSEPLWTRPDPETPPGRIEWMPIESRAFAETRTVGIYLPTGFADDRSYPIVILHDGKDFVDHAGLTTVLDNLIHRGDVPSFIAVLTQPGERNGEYTGDPRHADFLTEEVLPAIRQRFPTRTGPENCVLMGSSLGAVASLATAFRHPGTYGALALMSGSFIFDRTLLEARDPLFERVAELVDAMRADPARLPRRVFVSCGVYEGLISENRTMARFLAEQGIDVRFLETRDAHHWQNWRDQLHAALSWTLPPER